MITRQFTILASLIFFLILTSCSKKTVFEKAREKALENAKRTQREKEIASSSFKIKRKVILEDMKKMLNDGRYHDVIKEADLYSLVNNKDIQRYKKIALDSLTRETAYLNKIKIKIGKAALSFWMAVDVNDIKVDKVEKNLIHYQYQKSGQSYFYKGKVSDKEVKFALFLVENQTSNRQIGKWGEFGGLKGNFPILTYKINGDDLELSKTNRFLEYDKTSTETIVTTGENSKKKFSLHSIPEQ